MANLSVFDIIGPVMIGPSSSHTAGANRIAKIARDLGGEGFTKVDFIYTDHLKKLTKVTEQIGLWLEEF